MARRPGPRRGARRWLAPALPLWIAVSATGCSSLFESMGAALDYREAALPASRMRLDVPYRTDPEADPDKHRLDLFLPEEGARGWPTLIFVHGGGWTEGDRATRVLGIEPNRNIGRFYAARGYAAAIVSYRLQPEVDWRAQVRDVADATAWVHEEVARLGGNEDAIVLAGHSAGAWLAAWVGLDDAALERAGASRASLCGLVLVSGAAYDLEDEETWRLGASRAYFEDLFGDDDPDWARAASIRHHLDPPFPPTLVMTAGGEPPKFQRQSDLLVDALDAMGASTQRFVVPGGNHQRIAVGLSLEGDPASNEILEFLSWTACFREAG